MHLSRGAIEDGWVMALQRQVEEKGCFGFRPLFGRGPKRCPRRNCEDMNLKVKRADPPVAHNFAANGGSAILTFKLNPNHFWQGDVTMTKTGASTGCDAIHVRIASQRLSIGDSWSTIESKRDRKGQLY